MDTLHLALLGPPQGRRADQELRFSTRKELALLIYLAVESRVHFRKKLSELFWPERDAIHGRASLRLTLFHLRRLLGGGRGFDPHLLIKRDTLGLNVTTAFDLDLHTLHNARTLAHASTSTALTMPENVRQTMLSQLHHASTLPRGEFLEGFSLPDAPAFDDWVRFQREYWYLQVNDVFDRLSSLQFEMSELTPAIETVKRWIALAPLHEEAYQRLMRLHFAAGNRTAALHVYETCRVRLSTDVQTEPTLETVALASRMRAVTPPRRKKAPLFPETASPTALLHSPLLGRTEELSRLIKRYHMVQHGQPQVVFLEGEAGIGKTRLATEFLASAVMEGADVLQGQAFEAGGQLPYRPLIEALRPRIERENAPDDLLSDLWLAEFARLLPELYDRYPDLPAPVAEATVARNRLFEAVTRLLQSLAARTPLIVFIDDVQWVDATSFDVLHYLARRFMENATPILFLLTLRLWEGGGKPAVASWQTSLERAAPVTRIPLGPLSREEVLSLLQVLEGQKAEKRTADLESFGQWLFAETEGQPFYLMETLKDLLERGVLVSHRSKDGSWAIDFTGAMSHETLLRGFFPPSVREIICARLDRLTSDASALLMAGAVLGRESSFEHLCQVADLKEQDGLLALDEVLHSHLLQESEREEKGYEYMDRGHYRFTHPNIRAVVSAEAGEARRSIFHRRALEVLHDRQVPAAELCLSRPGR